MKIDHLGASISGGDCKPTQTRRSGFTLIELLVVIAIIAILAALIFPVTAAVNRIKMQSKARAELAEVKLAIDTYKAKLGFYPPDNPPSSGSPGSPSLTPLYFELLGTTNAGTVTSPVYVTLDGSARIAAGAMSSVFGPNVKAFMNCTQPGGGDEKRSAMAFLSQLKPGQIARLSNTSVPAAPPLPNQVAFLVCSVPTPRSLTPAFLGTPGLTPINYVSSNPTNNPATYDLWIDIMIGGKTNRICNWNQKPIVLQ